jgi:hypothetical protein
MYKPRWNGTIKPGVRVEVVVQAPVYVPQPVLKAKYVIDTGTGKSVSKYTGTAMLGVAQMHKSNAVPVFSNNEAVELAQMRRN